MTEEQIRYMTKGAGEKAGCIDKERRLDSI